MAAAPSEGANKGGEGEMTAFSSIVDGDGAADVMPADQRSMGVKGSKPMRASASACSSRHPSSCHVCTPDIEEHLNSTATSKMNVDADSLSEQDPCPSSSFCGCSSVSVEHEHVVRQPWRRSRKQMTSCSVPVIVGASAAAAAVGIFVMTTTTVLPSSSSSPITIPSRQIPERIRWLKNNAVTFAHTASLGFPGRDGLPGQQPSPRSSTINDERGMHGRPDVGTTASNMRAASRRRSNNRADLLLVDLPMRKLYGDEPAASTSEGVGVAHRDQPTELLSNGRKETPGTDLGSVVLKNVKTDSRRDRDFLVVDGGDTIPKSRDKRIQAIDGGGISIGGQKLSRARRRTLKSSKSSKSSHTKIGAKLSKYRYSKQSKGVSSSRSHESESKSESEIFRRRRTRSSESSDSKSSRNSRNENSDWQTTLDKLRARADETETTGDQGAASTEEEDFYQFFLMDDEDYLSSMPTISPTTGPTPTYSPTVEPTLEPTPTYPPTLEPTAEPSTSETNPPTITAQPTVITEAPTFTMQPTTSTPEPTTLSPTFDPTLDPTEGPTFDPTMDPTLDPTLNPTFSDDFDCTRVLDGDNGLVRLSWDFPFEDGAGQTLLRLRMKYAGIGWLGWGVPDTEDGGMVGSDAVIGLPNLPNSQTNPGRYELNGRSLSQIDLMPNRRQTLIDASVEQTESSTAMTFTYILNERERDNSFDVDGQNIMWAYGFSNTLGYHRDRGRSTIDFTECPPTAAPTRSDTLEPTQEPTPDFTVQPTDVPTADSFDCERIVDNNGFVKFSWNEPFEVAGRTLLTSRISFAGIGWIGWGIPTSSAGQMIGSDAVISLPDLPNSRTNPGKYSLNAKGLAGVVLDPIVEQDLIDSSVVQTDEDTIMTFTYILNQPGSNPVDVDGGMNTFIWAYGFSNNLGYHRNRGSFETDFSCRPTQAPTVGPDTVEPTMEPSVAPQSTTQLPTQAFEYEVSVDENNLVQYAWNAPFEVADRMFLTSRLTYAGVGWLGWGVPDSPEGNMIGSTAVIGKPEEPEGRFNPGKYKLEGRFLGGIVPFPLIQQTLIDATIEQSAGRTAMTWTMILDETNFNPINENNQTFIWACGFDNTFGLHRKRGSFVVNLMMSTPTPSAMPSDLPSSSPSASAMPTTVNRPSTSPSLSSMPSSAPTVSELPSAGPSDIPSVSHRPSISLAPTTSASPSTSHSPSISLSPTLFAYPSVSPAPSTSSVPSDVPSNLPSVSLAPSSQPSQQPTTSNPPSVSFVPTVSLKPSMSHSPSLSPRPSESSERPSVPPSNSLRPSMVPSSQPSVSLEPSTVPSQTPSISLQPSTVPSAQPSISSEPSTVPSQTPSVSLSPSATPSVLPSVSNAPTAFQGLPSASPSVAPSSQPSLLPSSEPSVVPSSEPSLLPSTSPSSSPSLEPSGTPSAAPTDKTPSSEPSLLPSDEPSQEPSNGPSTEPSSAPSLSPSSAPSLSPSLAPSLSPSAGPSSSPTTA